MTLTTGVREGGVGMRTTYVHALAWLDGCIADERDDVGPLHDWYPRMLQDPEVVVHGHRVLHLRDRVEHGAPK
jgi:hypothetical protein